MEFNKWTNTMWLVNRLNTHRLDKEYRKFDEEMKVLDILDKLRKKNFLSKGYEVYYNDIDIISFFEERYVIPSLKSYDENIEFLLLEMVKRNLVESDKNNYRISPSGTDALEKFNIEERRHIDNQDSHKKHRNLIKIYGLIGAIYAITTIIIAIILRPIT